MTTSPLLVTQDDPLLEDVLRLAAAAGVVLDVAHDVVAAQRSWAAASVVLVGADLASALADTGPPRRAQVHVVARGSVADELFRAALRLGAEDVAELPLSESWLVETLTDATDASAGARGRGVTIGVVGGSGGAGATVFAAALATTLARTWSTLVVDTDLLGAGIDRVLGVERRAGVRWDALHHATGRLGARALREALPHRDGLSVLTWPEDRPAGLQPFAVREVLSAAQRGHEAVVLDLPRHPDPVLDEVLTRCDHVVLVCGTTVPAVTAATRVARRLAAVPARGHLVVRGSGGVRPGEIADVLSVALVAAMPDQRGLDEAVDLGVGPLRSRRGPLARAAQATAAVVAQPAVLVA